jgi:iron-sulfur cluster assembly protein
MNTLSFSPAALEQIKKSVQESEHGNMGLRIAARMTADESINYGIGFDEAKDDDIKFDSEGVTILISPDSEELLHGAHVDYVELEKEGFNFIFLNPNDPNYKSPTEEAVAKED